MTPGRQRVRQEHPEAFRIQATLCFLAWLWLGSFLCVYFTISKSKKMKSLAPRGCEKKGALGDDEITRQKTEFGPGEWECKTIHRHGSATRQVSRQWGPSSCPASADCWTWSLEPLGWARLDGLPPWGLLLTRSQGELT